MSSALLLTNASFSHDLKEPVRKVITFAERLKNRMKHKLDEDDHWLLNKISVNVSNISSVAEAEYTGVLPRSLLKGTITILCV